MVSPQACLRNGFEAVLDARTVSIGQGCRERDEVLWAIWPRKRQQRDMT